MEDYSGFLFCLLYCKKIFEIRVVMFLKSGNGRGFKGKVGWKRKIV